MVSIASGEAAGTAIGRMEIRTDSEPVILRRLTLDPPLPVS